MTNGFTSGEIAEQAIKTQRLSTKLLKEANMKEIRTPKNHKRESRGIWQEGTEKKKFLSENNPHELIRCTQKDKYIWYASYDEEMLSEKFSETINMCSDKSLPIVNIIIDFSGRKYEECKFQDLIWFLLKRKRERIQAELLGFKPALP